MQSISTGRSSKGVSINYKLFVPPALVSEFADKWDSYIGKPVSHTARTVCCNDLAPSYT